MKKIKMQPKWFLSFEADVITVFPACFSSFLINKHLRVCAIWLIVYMFTCIILLPATAST